MPCFVGRDRARLRGAPRERATCALLALVAVLLPLTSSLAQRPAPAAARTVYVDTTGTIRWRDSGKEVVLFGANYTLPSASDYRAAGYLTNDRKKLIDDDMAHFARMGWDGLRIGIWGDWENTDHAGNLIANDHLDLVDYLIARARERGIYILLTPITTYESTWPDATQDTTPPGFSNFFKKSELGTNPAAIAAQVNYIQQLLRHVNPYTGVALKDEPSILFVEMINEPTHHSADVAGSVAEEVHQLRPGLRDAARVPADRRRLIGEAVAGKGRQHEVERVLGGATMRRRVRERADDLEQLDDRARPAVRDDQRQRVLVRRLHMDEVDTEAVDLGLELR